MKTTFCVMSERAMPMEEMINPVIMVFRARQRITNEEMITWKMMIYNASKLVINSASIWPSLP